MPRVLWCAPILLVSAATAASGQQSDPGRKQARAIRVPAGAILLDGRLDEDVWTKAPRVSDFVQKERAAPVDRIEVAFAYDDTVGARTKRGSYFARRHVRLSHHARDHVFAVKMSDWISPR